MADRIAFAGYARAGKDEAAAPLIALGYVRYAFGDIIKRQIDPLVRNYIGFSAFTEDDAQKKLIRGLLEQWGEANYAGITEEYFRTLPERAVNTRLVRISEARHWKDQGGIIVCVDRFGTFPATDWEGERLAELQESGLIDHWLPNNGTKKQLHERVLEIANA